MARTKGATDKGQRKSRKPSVDEKALSKAKAAMGNGVNVELWDTTVQAVEALYEDIASIMGEAMSRAKAVHDQINQTVDAARAKGLPTRAFKAEIKIRALDRRKAEIYENLESDDRSFIDQAHGVEGTPLGDFLAEQEDKNPKPLLQLASSIEDADGDKSAYIN